jgi:hypothetical protein
MEITHFFHADTEGNKPVNPVVGLKLNQLWFMSQLSNIEVLGNYFASYYPFI